MKVKHFKSDGTVVEEEQPDVVLTQKEINQQTIEELKTKLRSTDYQAIKYAEGELTEEEYAPIKAQRKEWRVEINRLEVELNGN